MEEKLKELVRTSRDWYDLEQVIQIIQEKLPMAKNSIFTVTKNRVLTIKHNKIKYYMRVNGVDLIDLYRVEAEELIKLRGDFYIDELLNTLFMLIYVITNETTTT